MLLESQRSADARSSAILSGAGLNKKRYAHPSGKHDTQLNMPSLNKPLHLSGLAFAVLLLGLPTLALGGQVTTVTFPSITLGGPYPYAVYLPDQPAESGSGYPVVYLLHGSFGSATDWLEQGALEATADALIREGAIPPTVIVMPGSQSWWLDGQNEAAATAFLSDLVPHIESTYPVSQERSGRFVAGLSAGGYGATRFALMHPERFAAAAALSPATYVPLPPANSSAYRHPAFLDGAGDFDQGLWQRNNYTAYWDYYRNSGLTVAFYINSGDHDEFAIAYHAAVLYETLRQHQPDAVELRIVDGAHNWEVWRSTLPDTLTFLLSHYRP